MLCCYNRPQFLEDTLKSLAESDLTNSIICIIDDCSSNSKTIELINNFYIPGVKIIKKRNSKSIGISKSLSNGFEIVYHLAEYLTNIDSDTIMKKDWLNKLKTTYKEVKETILDVNDVIITGFNCTNCKNHPIIKTYDKFNIKRSIGGVNMFFRKQLYPELFKNALRVGFNGWDLKVIQKARNINILPIATIPSVIQHIGSTGLNSKKNRYDFAADF